MKPKSPLTFMPIAIFNKNNHLLVLGPSGPLSPVQRLVVSVPYLWDY